MQLVIKLKNNIKKNLIFKSELVIVRRIRFEELSKYKYIASNILVNEFKKHNNKKRLYLCIGTPRVVWDSFGPMVGSLLKSNMHNDNYRVLGTVEEPVSAQNILEVLKGVNLDEYMIVSIDASVGVFNAGDILIKDGGLKPGLALDKDLGSFGDLSILGYITGINARAKDSYKEIIKKQSVFVAQAIIEAEEHMEKSGGMEIEI